MEQTIKNPYEAPVTEVLELTIESILAASLRVSSGFL